jgi:hypothetical protein
MQVTVTGVVNFVGELEEVGRNAIQKKVIVVETEGQYSQKIPIEFLKDKVHMLDDFFIGDRVDVSANMRGTDFNGKYYLSLNGWKIIKI